MSNKIALGRGYRLEFSISRRRLDGRREAVPLNDIEKHGVQGNIETISQLGIGQIKAFQEPGSHIRITERGITVIPEIPGARQFFSTRNLDGPLRKNVKNTLKVLAGIASSSDLLIQVRVVSLASFFKKCCEQQEAFQNSLSSIEDSKELKDTSRKMLELMHQVKQMLEDGKIEESVQLYAQKMPEVYGAFSDAMRNYLGSDHQQYLNHMEFQLKVAQELFRLTQTIGTHAQALTKMSEVKKSFENDRKLFESVNAEFKACFNQELAFNQQIQKAITKFQDNKFINSLVSKKWTNKEITDYMEKLKALKIQSDKVLKALQIKNQCSLGQLQKTMDDLCLKLEKRMPAYILALKEFIVIQKVARGRTLLDIPDCFSLDLKHLNGYKDLIETISETADHSNSNHLKSESWKKSLHSIQETLKDFDHQLKTPLMALAINDTHKGNQEFTKELGVFVQAYQQNRKLFDETMLRNGISEVQSAFIFNHYIQLYDQLLQWDAQFQTCVDLCNQQKYTEALDEYTLLIETRFKDLVKNVRNIYFTSTDLAKPVVRKAFLDFSSSVGLPNPAQTFTTLATQRGAIKQQIRFDECLKGAKKQGLIVSDRAIQAKSMTDDAINAEELQPRKFDKLFAQKNSLTTLFFNYKGKGAAAWQSNLKKHGWTTVDRLSFTLLLNDYAALIRSIRKAEVALEKETDSTKKSTLEARLRFLVKQSQKLNSTLDTLGGLKKFNTILEAAEESKDTELVNTATYFVKLIEARLRFVEKRQNKRAASSNH